MRTYSFADKILFQFDKTLKSLFEPTRSSTITTQTNNLDIEQTKHSATLMRINHCGEVCAQALYLGQALVARDQALAKELYTAADEEKTHLNWCANRVHELNSHLSVFNPLFAATSFGIGIIAGLSGDKISLGFLAETENQVTQHLEKHLAQLPPQDERSRAILIQMQEDEKRHATHAIHLGGVQLPHFVCFGMKLMSKVMTTTTRYL